MSEPASRLAGGLCSDHGYYSREGCPGCPTRLQDPMRYEHLDRLRLAALGQRVLAPAVCEPFHRIAA